MLSLLAGSAALGCAGEDSLEASADGSVDGADDEDAGPCGPATGAQTEGPFYPGEPPARMDIIGDRKGVTLDLDLRIVRAGTCETIAGAEVDVWSADAAGDYSGYAAFGTEGQNWLRGQQTTDAEGLACFTTIVPGSYPGRAVHIHVKVRAAGLDELTTQIYFPDGIVGDVLNEPGYTGAAQTTNAADGFYADDTLVELSGDLQGFVGAVTLIVG